MMPHRRLPPREKLMREIHERLLILNADEPKQQAWLRTTDKVAIPNLPEGFADFGDRIMEVAEATFKGGYTAALTDLTDWLTRKIDG